MHVCTFFTKHWCGTNKYISFPNKLSLLQVMFKHFFHRVHFCFLLHDNNFTLTKPTKTHYKVAKIKSYNIMGKLLNLKQIN